MQRYTINFSPSEGPPTRLLVPFYPSSTVGELTGEFRRRLGRQGIAIGDGLIQLRVNVVDGALLDHDDALEDVVTNPRREQLFASLQVSNASTSNEAVDQDTQIPQAEQPVFPDIPEPVTGGIHIRVTTPSRSVQQDIFESAPIPRRFPTTISLQQLRQVVATQLGLPVLSAALPDNAVSQCNCSFAHAINNENTLAKGNWKEQADSENAFLFIHSDGVVEKLYATTTDDAGLITRSLEAAKQKFGDNVELTKCLNAIKPRVAAGAELKLPIITLCTKAGHPDPNLLMYGVRRNSRMPQLPGAGHKVDMLLDLHTAESPISNPRSSLTIAEIGLEEVLVEGILNLYATTRNAEPTTHNSNNVGKAMIFKSAPHWEPEVVQSERGKAMLLSTLRVFCASVRGKRQVQDAIMRLLHQLTNFPPAVRTMHILMSDMTPTPAECSALAHSVFQVLKKHFPKQIIKFDNSRLFEASRLFFGLILDKARQICRVENNGSMLPHLTSMKTVNITDQQTREPLVNPVDTCAGLLEKGCFDAICSGLIALKDASDTSEPLVALPLDGRAKRAVMLSGGLLTQQCVFDTDILYSSDQYKRGSQDDEIINPAEMDVSHLAVLCSRNGLTVVNPSRLASASDPALTLDSIGLPAVYVGRVPCGDPGRDFLIFRPTRVGDSGIDPAIVAQLLTPILSARQADGTAVFDAPGDVARRKIETPDEILMVNVDCSASMTYSAGFRDIVEDDEPQHDSRSLLERLDLVAEADTITITLDEIKEMLLIHESFDDIVRTINQVREPEQARVTDTLIGVLCGMAGKELKYHSKRLETFGGRLTSSVSSPLVASTRLQTEGLKKLIVGVQRHLTPITDWIIFRARMSSDDGHHDWLWEVGNPIPGVASTSVVLASESLQLEIPHDYLCAITYELLTDPVSTSDGHVYERSAIQKWLAIRKTSPKTGLRLTSTRLSSQRRLLAEISNWVDGEGFRQSPSLLSSRLKLTFSSHLGTFERAIKLTASCSDLYHIVFQALKGRHSKFELTVRNQRLQPSDDMATTKGVSSGCTISIALPEVAATQPSSSSLDVGTSDMRLIKVYNGYNSCLFSYWVPKSTDAKMSSILFKYWRKIVLPWGLAGALDLLRTWTGMKDKGDNYSAGWIRKSHEKLSTYLTPEYARGTFDEESVFDAAGAPFKGVLKVYITSKSSKSHKRRTSRMDVLKQMFDQFVNRTIAYNFNTHLGLITFDSTARVARPLTDIVEDFRSTVNQLEPNSDTAIWDSLALAHNQIEEYAARFPNAKKRILCISDGEDNKSSRPIVALTDTLVRSGIVVDSFIIGQEMNHDLLAVSHLTGGFKFAPKTLSQAMAICELEPVLSLKDRQDIVVQVPPRGSTQWSRFNIATQIAEPEVMNDDVFPKRRPHPNIEDDVIELTAARRIASSGQSSGGESSRMGSNLRSSRLLTEIQNAIANRHPHYDIYVSERDISFWKIVMQGPPDTPYAEGTFLLYLHLDEQYPTFAPKGRFVTPIYHPNVNRNGRICHSIFDRNWTSDTSCANILNSVYGLLLVPDYSDTVNVVVTLDYHRDQNEFADAVRSYITKHASKDREQWRQELLGTD